MLPKDLQSLGIFECFYDCFELPRILTAVDLSKGSLHKHESVSVHGPLAGKLMAVIHKPMKLGLRRPYLMSMGRCNPAP